MIYFPPERTLSGHAMVSKNVDWFLVPLDVHINKTEVGNRSYTRNFLIEIYPDRGYSTIAASGGDLNSVLDGMNSEGLGISALADEWINPLKMPYAGDRNSGNNEHANSAIGPRDLQECGGGKGGLPGQQGVPADGRSPLDGL